MGRPEIEIDAKQVEQLASLGAKNIDIAEFFGCSTDTIERRYAAELSKGRSSLKMRLRQLQLKAAEKGNVVMLIWLGKQMLDQKDKTAHELSGPDGKPIETKSVTELSPADLDAEIKLLLPKGE